LNPKPLPDEIESLTLEVRELRSARDFDRQLMSGREEPARTG
jgi:hypothetical protein